MFQQIFFPIEIHNSAGSSKAKGLDLVGDDAKILRTPYCKHTYIIGHYNCFVRITT